MADTYTDAVLDPLRARGTKVFLIVEVILFVAGFGFSQVGTQTTSLGAHPDTHLAMGAVFGGLGIAFGAAGILIYVLAVALSIRNQTQIRTDF
jgi:high-affinity Fe2+/Pb2+ permease